MGLNDKVRKTDFVLALGRLGLVLTHGQAATLATKHHGDYEKFLATLGDPRQKVCVCVGGSWQAVYICRLVQGGKMQFSCNTGLVM